MPTNTDTSQIETIDPSNGINATTLAKIVVHNSAGECTVSLVNSLAKEAFQQAGPGHYLLCTKPDQDPLASVTVREDGVKIYPERMASDLAVGEHALVVGWRMPLGDKPSVQSPGMRC